MQHHICNTWTFSAGILCTHKKSRIQLNKCWKERTTKDKSYNHINNNKKKKTKNQNSQKKYTYINNIDWKETLFLAFISGECVDIEKILCKYIVYVKKNFYWIKVLIKHKKYWTEQKLHHKRVRSSYLSAPWKLY